MKIYWRTSFIFILFAFTGFAHAQDCQLNYSQTFIKRVVIPILEKKYGNHYTYFNVNSPEILRKSNGIVLVFDGVKPDEGVLPNDGPVYFMLFDKTTCRLIKSYEAPPYSY